MLHTILEEIDDVTAETQQYVEQYVKTYPLQSMGIAVVLGILIAKIIL
jgi:ElaB/YqjD/DUF883 family membrane-anchored ribosome-binding protein